MPSTLLSSTKNSGECKASTPTDDDLAKKRRQLLIRSAKRPFKRSRLIQQNPRREEKEETDTVTTASLSSASSETTKPSARKKSRGKPLWQHKSEKPRKRRMVFFDTKYNMSFSVPSHNDLSTLERESYFLQKEEYLVIKKNIQKTIEFLRSPNDISISSGSASSSGSTSRSNSAEDEHCVRGLECLAEDFVSDHKRRVQKNSKSAVFQFQENRRRRLAKTSTTWTNEMQLSQTIDEAHEASLALAEVYRKCTVECESIARRWGHFDAIDAGADPTSSSTTAVTCATVNFQACKESSTVDNSIIVENAMDYNASLSSLSYDGDDCEEENENNEDFNLPPVVDAAKSVHGFDSLPDGLFNF